MLLILAAQGAFAESGTGDIVSKSLIVTARAGSNAALEISGKTIGDIRIDNRDVFDTEAEGESGALYQFANALHIQTRPEVIRQQLLVHEGEPFVARSIEESERLLRSNRYLSTVEIRPVRLDGDTVDIEVVTEDTWSLKPSVQFSRKGGTNTGGVQITDSNLFGSGSEVGFGFKSGLERDEFFVSYKDPQLGASRTAFAFGYADTSDGQRHEIAIQQPFYSLDARRAGGIIVSGFDQVDSLYSMSEADRRFDHSAEHVEMLFGWSPGLRNETVGRWTTGIVFDDHLIAPLDESGPNGLPSRRDIYPFLGYEWIQDRFETIRNADNLQIVEDWHVGMRLTGRVGYASEIWGSKEDAWLMSVGMHRGFKLFGRDTVLTSLNASTRLSVSAPTQSLLEGRVRYYHRQSPKRLLFASASVMAGRHLDPDQQLMLGGENGLRGYPIHHLNGDVVTLLTLEQRFYTDWYPLHLFRVGAAVFLDAGKVVRPDDEEPGFEGWYRDVGVGLRISSPRSSSGRMLHLDYACPLDAQPDRRQCQFVVETRRSF